MRVFLSYHSPDRALAERLATALTQHDSNLDIFLDTWALQAGAFWLPELAAALERADALVLLLGANSPGPWQALEYQKAFDRKAKQREFALVPVVVGAAQPRLPFLDQLHWLRLTDPTTEEALTQLVSALCHPPKPSPLSWSAAVVQDLTKGVSALPTDYAERIENFLFEYLGSLGQPVPFGGREAELADLDHWLADPHAAPYRLLAAEAGRGKSALLVRWIQALAIQTDLAVVFVPISIRFRTNLASVTFAALTARLAKLHHEELRETVNTPAEVWRGLMAEYLRRPLPDGRRLLLIVDGLDEAADWQPGPDLFPLQPPVHLRILVSARYLAGDRGSEDWLRRLGWDHRRLALPSGLPVLSREGVAQVLQQMGCPLDQLATRVDVVGELYRLSQGDPLLVRLYVDELWQRGEEAVRLKPENLQNLAPGLSGYFDRWWDDQKRLWGHQSPLREPIVKAFLNLLACAFGPLRLVDLQHLGSFLQPPLEFGEFDIEDTLRTLSRFIIGDGKEQGYAFHHPRLTARFERSG